MGNRGKEKNRKGEGDKIQNGRGEPVREQEKQKVSERDRDGNRERERERVRGDGLKHRNGGCVARIASFCSEHTEHDTL